MVTRSFAALLLPVAAMMMAAGCDRPPPDRKASARPPEPAPPTPFGNQAASQSIMQPKVIAETAPVDAPPAAVEPARLPGATIAFASGARLDDAARSGIDALLADPALPEAARYVLRGHSDSEGSDGDNLRTSRRRALAVQAYLIEKGVGADRIRVIALGERRPIAPNATAEGDDDPAGRARNRRVDIEVAAPIVEPAPAPSDTEAAVNETVPAQPANR